MLIGYRMLQDATPNEIRRQALYGVFVPFCYILMLPIGLPIAIVLGICRHTVELFAEILEQAGDIIEDIACFLKRPKNKIKDYLEHSQMVITGKLPDRIIKEFEEESTNDTQANG